MPIIHPPEVQPAAAAALLVTARKRSDQPAISPADWVTPMDAFRNQFLSTFDSKAPALAAGR
jgi:hypothetical protein